MKWDFIANTVLWSGLMAQLPDWRARANAGGMEE
jgi:hypothetical protein